MKKLFAVLAMLTVAVTSGCASIQAYNARESTKDALRALDDLRDSLRRNYYDKNMRGQNMDAHYETAKGEIAAAQTDQERARALAKFLMHLDDSHTYYTGFSWTPLQRWAPPLITLEDYGFSYRFYGDAAFVSAVNKWTQADSVGLRRGDQILKFDGRPLVRDDQRRTLVEFLGRHPIPDLALEVRAPDQTVRTLTVRADTAAIFKVEGKEFREIYKASLDSTRRAQSHITATLADRVFVWKLPEFENADLKLGKVARAANQHDALILDLRGNPGGPIDRLEEVLGFFVEKPVEVGTLQMRWDEKKYEAKPKGDRFKGKTMIVLIDSETASAAEVFARLVQLERDAIVVGDRSAGAVMASRSILVASITVSDFVLYNGERLEKVGVKPDIAVVPTAADIALGHDPVLAAALAHVGIKVTPAQAAKVLSQ